MPIYQVLVLAIIQGLTEFIPVSSSGHLALAPWLFGWKDPGLSFDVALHVGTLAAVLILQFVRGLRFSTSTPGLSPQFYLFIDDSLQIISPGCDTTCNPHAVSLLGLSGWARQLGSPRN